MVMEDKQRASQSEKTFDKPSGLVWPFIWYLDLNGLNSTLNINQQYHVAILQTISNIQKQFNKGWHYREAFFELGARLLYYSKKPS